MSVTLPLCWPPYFKSTFHIVGLMHLAKPLLIIGRQASNVLVGVPVVSSQAIAICLVYYIYICRAAAPAPSKLLVPLPSSTIAMTPSLNYDNLIKNVRKLVPFLPPEPISPRNTKKQDTSPLYAKLPPELRQMIWITYFHGHAVHLVIRGKKLCGKECLNWEGDFSFRGHSHMGSCRKRGTQLQCGHISLALTCKKMYISHPIYFTSLH